jgi:hypothetical protein
MPNDLRMSRLAGCAPIGSEYDSTPTKTLDALTPSRRLGRLHALVGQIIIMEYFSSEYHLCFVLWEVDLLLQVF